MIANEVHDITVDGGLSPEVETLFAQPSEVKPQLHLVSGHGPAKLAGDFIGHAEIIACHPTRRAMRADLPVKGRYAAVRLRAIGVWQKQKAPAVTPGP